MKLGDLFTKLGTGAAKAPGAVAPKIGSPKRFPYGPFRFIISLPRPGAYEIRASTDLQNWQPIATETTNEVGLEYLDTEASKFPSRFYRVFMDGVASETVLGYNQLLLPPGFAMIANPFQAEDNSVGALLAGWPNSTKLNKFDNTLFRLTDNAVVYGKWQRPEDQLLPGEGGILFNPSAESRPLIFAGAVVQGNLQLPIPPGFSLRSSLVPQNGALVEELGFPIAEGDVVHLFDRDKKDYVLFPYEQGGWAKGAPKLVIGESFWIAKAAAANWVRAFAIPA